MGRITNYLVRNGWIIMPTDTPDPPLPSNLAKGWQPNSDEQRAILIHPLAPHETAAVLRMNQHGWPGWLIARELGIPQGPLLVGAMKRGIEKESEAARVGVPIHNATVQKGTK